MNKKRLTALLVMLTIGLFLVAIGLYANYTLYKEEIHNEEVRLACVSIDAAKSTVDFVRSRHDCGDFDPECQQELVEWINLHIDSYEEHYIMWENEVGEIPRESTLPRVSITPIPTCTLTPTPTLTITPSPTPTNTPIPTSTPTPTPELKAPDIGKVEIWTDEVCKEEYTGAIVSIDDIVKESVKIRWRGNSSTWMKKKSYNVKFNDKVNPYELGDGKKWSLLATAYEKTLLRTPLGFWYGQAIGLPYVSDFRVVELWLNDDYQGVYVLIEPIQDGKDRIDLDLNKGDFLIECSTIREEEGKSYIKTDQGFKFELNEPEEPADQDKQFIVDYLNQIETAIMTKDYDVYSKYIDVESFVNYYIFEEVTKNVDFGRLSTRYFCKGGKLYAGPPWDMDLTMGNVSVTHDEGVYRRYNNSNTSGKSYEGLWVKGVTWYKWLCDDEYFMELVKERWNELLPITNSLVYPTETSVSVIDYFLEAYQSYFEKNYSPKSNGGAGWRVDKQSLLIDYDYPADTYIGNVEQLEDWLINRIDWLNVEFNK